jgi:carboxylesterase
MTNQKIDDRGYKFEGGPTGVLLVHGLGGTPIEMRYVALGLARAGHTVHVPQLAGHCGTAEDIKRSRWQDWMGSLDDALTELRKSCDTVVVAGLSAGGVMGLQLAAERAKDVQGVALFAPTLWLDGWSVPWYAPFFRLVHMKWFANKINFIEREPYGIKDRRLREMVVQALHSGDSSQAGLYCTPGGTMLELRWLVNQLKPRLGNITQPTLLIHPRDDDRADISNSIYLMRKLGGLVETVVLDDSYHIVTVDKQRELVVEHTASFVARVGAKSAAAVAGGKRSAAA